MAKTKDPENADYLVAHAGGMQEWVGPLRLAELGKSVTVVETRPVPWPEETPATPEDAA